MIAIAGGKRRPIDIADTMMGKIMNNYCAAHYVWDGVHKRGQGEKFALKASLPVLEKCHQGL